MNRYWIILILFSSCINIHRSLEDKHEISMTIKSVEFDIDTPYDIDCKDFENYFKDIHTKIINDSQNISRILKTLNTLKIADSNYYQHVDTRLKLEINYDNDSTETICMDRLIISRNNRYYINSDTLKAILTRD